MLLFVLVVGLVSVAGEKLDAADRSGKFRWSGRWLRERSDWRAGKTWLAARLSLWIFVHDRLRRRRPCLWLVWARRTPVRRRVRRRVWRGAAAAWACWAACGERLAASFRGRRRRCLIASTSSLLRASLTALILPSSIALSSAGRFVAEFAELLLDWKTRLSALFLASTFSTRFLSSSAWASASRLACSISSLERPEDPWMEIFCSLPDACPWRKRAGCRWRRCRR